ncbi:XF1762 family protein [Eubacterium limosum]|uniref:XF1762 family protein n=1 Tax=Eubacterium limosum TaxID=1736 RepID=UPI001063060B|nr:XF1762 family protein [Eubacterium limosum]
MEIRPISLKQANEFVKNNHRHHGPTVGHKFSLGLYDNGEFIGCAICGRPVSRHLDNGVTCEINRLCTTGKKNACSMLYGACCRVAKEMGYKKIITYTLESENGSSLRASNFKYDGIAGGKIWSGERNRDRGVPKELKKRWFREL